MNHQYSRSLPKQLKWLRKVSFNMLRSSFCFIMSIFYNPCPHIATCFRQSKWIFYRILIYTIFRVMFLIYYSRVTSFGNFTMIKAFAMPHRILIVLYWVKKHFHSVVDFAREVNFIVLSSSDEWIFQVRFEIFFVIVFAFAVALVGVECLL